MRVFLLFFMVTGWVWTSSAWADTEKPAGDGRNNGQAAITKEQQSETAADTEEAKSEQWPRSFQPSEKVDADSVLPFPVDI
jgi:uncharacterized iron-regulated membrane protein